MTRDILKEQVSKITAIRPYNTKEFKRVIKLYDNLFEYALSGPLEYYYWLMNDIHEYPKCIVCGEDVTRFRPGNDDRYSKLCSSRCSGIYSSLFIAEEIKKARSIKLVEKNRNRTKEEKELINAKKRKTMMERYGVENPQQVPEFRERALNTMMERYGVKHYAQNPANAMKLVELRRARYGNKMESIVEKCEQTMMERYGVKSPLQHDKFRSKIKQTNLEKYGNEWNIASNISRKKQQETCFLKYGFNHPMQNPDIKEKHKSIIKERYGVENVSQNTEIHMKKLKTGYQSKEFIFPSGKIVYVQGYEDRALELLLTQYDENDIEVEDKNMPEIWYYLDDIKKRYFPDIFIKSENLIIEVKSEYTYNSDLEINILKQQACLENGFNFKFLIL